MKKLLLLIIVILSNFLPFGEGLGRVYAQTYAPKDYYLIDSLDLKVLSVNHRALVDSCLSVYHESKSDTSRVRAIAEIVENCWNENVWPKYNIWLHNYLKNKLTNGKQINGNRTLIKAYANTVNNIGFHHYGIGNTNMALKFFHKSLEIEEGINDQYGISTSLNNIGGIYDDIGDIVKALEYYERSLKIRQEIDYQEGVSISLNNIAIIYTSQGDFERALELYEECIKIDKALGNKHGIGSSLNNIGNIYQAQGKLDESVAIFEECMKYRKDVGDLFGIASTLKSIAVNYSLSGDYTNSLIYHDKSLRIREQIQDKKGMAVSFFMIAKMYLKLNEFKKAEEYGKKSMNLSKELNYPSRISDASSILADVYKLIGDFEKALKMHELHIQMKDSTMNEKSQKATIRQQTKYEYEKKKAVDDKENEKRIALEKEKQKRQFIVLVIVVIASALVLILLVVIYRRLRITRKQKLVIEEQKEVVEEAHNEIKDSIKYAKRIQNAILPAPNVINEYLPESFFLYEPKDVVAGDFYWLESVGNTILFAAADCTGHGVPGAMVSVVCHNAMNRAVREFGLREPGLILDKTREIVVAEFEKSEDDVKDGMDIALCSLNGLKLQYAGAHNPLWIIRGNEIHETKADKQPIGKFDDAQPFTTHCLELQKGDSVYLFTDGYADQFGGEGDKKFGSKRFKELLLSIQDKTMQQQKEVLNTTFQSWMQQSGAEQIDDVCVIGINV